jgi:tetratricopeptide (TPR) repeat protein
MPTPGERLLERADALAAGGLPMDAVAVYRQLLAAEPEHLEGRLHLARLLVQLEELEGALAVLNDALRHAPDQTEFLVLRGGLYANLRLYPEADADLRRVLRTWSWADYSGERGSRPRRRCTSGARSSSSPTTRAPATTSATR